MATSTAAQAAEAAVSANTTLNPAPTPLGIPKDLPNAGIYLQQQQQAETAYQQAQAELLAKRNTSYHEYGLGADAAVDPNAQFGRYQGMLSSHESALNASDENAQQRGLGGGPGLGMQGERALRYQQGGEALQLQQDVGNIGQNYATGVQAALAARNAAVLQAQLNAAIGGQYAGGGSGGSGGGTSAGGGGIPLQWTSGARELLGSYGYSDEQIANAVATAMAQRGWGKYGNGTEDPQVMENGQRFNADGSLNVGGGDYIKVKVGTPQGNSTELIYIGPPTASQSAQPAASPTRVTAAERGTTENGGKQISLGSTTAVRRLVAGLTRGGNTPYGI